MKSVAGVDLSSNPGSDPRTTRIPAHQVTFPSGLDACFHALLQLPSWRHETGARGMPTLDWVSQRFEKHESPEIHSTCQQVG